MVVHTYHITQWGDVANGRSYIEESLTRFRELDIKWSIGSAFWLLGHLANHNGDLELARSLDEQSLQVARKENDKRSMAFALNALGEVARQQGDYMWAGEMYMYKEAA